MYFFISEALFDFKDQKQLCKGCDEDQMGKANFIFDRVSAKPIFQKVAKKYNVPATFKPNNNVQMACVGESIDATVAVA